MARSPLALSPVGNNWVPPQTQIDNLLGINPSSKVRGWRPNGNVTKWTAVKSNQAIDITGVNMVVSTTKGGVTTAKTTTFCTFVWTANGTWETVPVGSSCNCSSPASGGVAMPEGMEIIVEC